MGSLIMVEENSIASAEKLADISDGWPFLSSSTRPTRGVRFRNN